MGCRGLFLGSACVCAMAMPSVAQAKRVVYLNADPISINADNGQDPTLNSYSTTGFVAGSVSGWPELTDAQKNELTFLMKEASYPFNLEFVWERPASGSYDMVVMGTTADFTARFPDLGGCSTAVGLADCDDGNAENISFFFPGCLATDDQSNMDRVAHTIFTGLGFGWGMEQTTANGEIMGSFIDNGDSVEFGDTCQNISGTPNCANHVGCSAGQQNASAEVMARVGARIDDGPPMLAITEPLEGAQVTSNFDVKADVADGFGGLLVEMAVVEASVVQVDAKPPYSWTLMGVPDGEWTIQVRVVDADLNLELQQVHICVGDDPCDGGSGSGSDGGSSDEAGDESGGSTGGGDEGGSSESGGDTGGGDEGPNNDDSTMVDPSGLGQDVAPDTGCTCRSTPRPGAWAWLVLVGVPALRRRRQGPWS